MKKRAKWVSWAVFGAVVAVLLVAMTAAQNRPGDTDTAPAARFDDATPTGGKGFALVLNRLGFRSRAQYEPLQKMPADARAWLIFDPEVAFSKREATMLLKWVEDGGTLIFCLPGRSAFGFINEPDTDTGAGVAHLRSELKIEVGSFYTPTPARKAKDGPFLTLTPYRFGPVTIERSGVSKAQSSGAPLQIDRAHLPISDSASGAAARFTLGKGRVYVFADAWMFTNYGLSKPDNAVFATNLIRASNFERGVKDGGVAYFDERRHNESGAAPEPDSLIARLRKPPFSYAMWQLMAAALLLWAFAGRRLGTAIALPERGPVTRASQFALAMGGLFQKINRPRAASAIIGDTFRRRLAARLGMSPAEPDAVLARRAHEIAGLPFEQIDRLLLQTRTPASGESAALRDAQEMERVLERLDGR